MRPKRKPRTTKARGGKGCVISCPLCGMGGIELPGTPRICKCGGDCGIAFRNPRPSLPEIFAKREQLLSAGLQRLGKENLMRKDGLPETLMREFFRITQCKPAMLSGFNRRVLEINCGLGTTLWPFVEYGWGAFGTDMSDCAMQAAKKLPISIRKGLFELLNYDKPFDLIFCEDFAAVPGPVGCLTKAHSVLADEGVLCLMSARAEFSEDGALDNAKSHDSGAMFFYHEDSLRRLLASNGFEVVDESGPVESSVMLFAQKQRGWKR